MTAPGPPSALLLHLLPLLLLVAGAVLGQLQPPRLLAGVGDQLVLDTTKDPDLVLGCEGQQAVFWRYAPIVADVVNVVSSNNSDGDYPFRSTLRINNSFVEDTGFYSCGYLNNSMEAGVYVFVDDGKFNFVNSLETLSVHATTADDQLILDCRTSNPSTVVTLTKDGTPVTSFEFDPMTGYIGPKPTLMSSGEYTCSISNNRSDLTKTIHLQVSPGVPKKLPEPTIDAPGHGHFVVGHPYRLYCTVAHSQAVTFTWTNMNDVLKPISPPPSEVVTGTERTKKVAIDVPAEDVTEAGVIVYECNVNAKNYASSSTLFNVTVKEHEEPHLLVSTDIDIIRIKNGEFVQWKSTVDSFPDEAHIAYYNPRNERVIPDARISVTFDAHEGGEAWLMFSEITNEDFGVWVMEATTEGGLKNSTSLTITVLSAPHVSLMVPQVVTPSAPVTVTCEVVAFPLPDVGNITWHYADGESGCDTDSIIGESCPANSYKELQTIQTSFQQDDNRITVEATVPSASSFRLLRCSTINRSGSESSTALLVVSDLDDRWTLQVDGVPGSSNTSFLQVVMNDPFTVRCGATKGLYHSPQLTTPGGVSSTTNTTMYSESMTSLGSIATPASDGTYKCSVQTRYNDFYERSLTIEVTPEVRLSLSNKSNIEIGQITEVPIIGGEDFEIVCDARGSPPPTVQWEKDGEAMEFERGTILSPDGKRVSFLHFLQEDVGLYTCIITWRQERYEASVELFLKDPMSTMSKVFLGLAAAFIVALVLASIYLVRRLRSEKAKSEAAKQTRRFLFEKGNVNQLNPDFTAEEQAELLPYDKSFEVERDNIIIGRQLGSGAFGRVVKAEVIGLRDDEKRTPVAVKMCKEVTDPTHLRNLAIELKIMIHLGKHLNIVNLVGAYTSEIIKGELWLLVEYCKYGDLLSFLHRYRKRFVNQIDPVTDSINYSILSTVTGSATSPMSPGPNTIRTSGASTFTEGTDGYLLPNSVRGGQQLVLDNPPKGRISVTPTSPTSPTSPGASSLFADNPGYGKLSEMPNQPTTPQDLANIPQSPSSSSSQSPTPYTPLHPAPTVPSSPYVNLNPGGDGSPAPAYVQHGTRPSLGSRPPRGSVNNRSTMGSVSTIDDTTPYSAGSTMGSTMGSMRARVNTDMTTLTASYRPTSPDAFVDSQGRPIAPSDGSSIPGLSCPFTTTELVCWSWQIAQGMEYLTKRKVLHGDLAARNLLLADGNVIKISDFGLSRDMYKKEIYTKQGDDLLPIKWMSVEAIRDRMFSTESDIWAYGVVLWELFSLGQAPYPGVDVNPQFLQDLENGMRSKQPKYSNKEIYNLMLDCWREEPEDRPRFWEIRKRLDDMLKEDIRDNFATMNESYMRMNTDYFENRTDYLSMFTSPDFNKIQKDAEDLPYANIQNCQNDYSEKDGAAYLSMQQTVGGDEHTNNGGRYLAMSVVSGAAPPSPKDMSIFSPNPLDTGGEKPRFEFHNEEDLPSKMDQASESQVDNDDASPHSPGDKLLQPPPEGTTCPDASDEVHEKNSLLSQQSSNNYVNLPVQSKPSQRNQSDSNYVNFDAVC